MESFLQRNNGYLARQEIDHLHKHISEIDHKRLEPHGFKVYSQGDEDGILNEIFNRLGISRGTFLEIGVENGLECNSLLLLHQGWKGFWIEGNQNQAYFISDKYKSIIETGQLTPVMGMITPDNIDGICDQLGVDSSLDFLSIDIDGMDIHVFEKLKITPKVVCIEYNAKWPAHVSRVPAYSDDYAWTGTDYMGASLLSITKVAEKKGYVLVGTNITGANAFYVRKDLVKDKFSSDNSVKYLYNPPRYWLIFDHYWHIGHRADFGDYTE